MEGSEIGLGFLVLGSRDFDLGKKKTVHAVFRESFGDNSRPRVWERLRLGLSLVGEDYLHAGRRQLHDHLDFGCPVHDRTGIG